MRTLTKEELNAEYLIYKDLTPDKNYKTFIAMKEHSDGSLYPVILKEMDEKRAEIYQSLSNMWNPYIADTYEVIKLTSTENIYVAVTEYVYADKYPEKENLSLSEFVHNNGPLSESTALSICVQICEGLKNLHQKGIVHRDLKPDNIMISKYDDINPQIKIIDFGGAKQEKRTDIADTTVIGTLGYQPPESLSSHTTNKSDIYSIGCILNFLLTKTEPGIKQYVQNHYIVNIIEKATNEDPYYRYLNVTAMQKQLRHELKLKPIDNIPILRTIPGFRTHTIWKEGVSLAFWITLLYFVFVYSNEYSISACIELLFFMFFIPLVLIFNIGNLLRFFPRSLRKNNFIFVMVRICIIFVSIFFLDLIDVFMR